jgi:hypothetical protein
MTYLVLHVRPYSFKDDSGRQVEGTTVTYLDVSMEPYGDELGYAPLQLSAPPELGQRFTRVPGFYQLDFRQRRGKGGKPTISLAGATFQGGADLVETVERA